MKIILFSLFTFCFWSSGYCQQLSIDYFERSCTNSQPDINNELSKNGFSPDSDIVLPNYHKFSFESVKANERVEWKTITDKVVTKSIIIHYYLPLKNNYKNFKQKIKKSKYKRQSSKLYRFSSDSYSHQSFSFNDEILFNNKKYYLITFTHYEGKELSMPEK